MAARSASTETATSASATRIRWRIWRRRSRAFRGCRNGGRRWRFARAGFQKKGPQPKPWACSATSPLLEGQFQAEVDGARAGAADALIRDQARQGAGQLAEVRVAQ